MFWTTFFFHKNVVQNISRNFRNNYKKLLLLLEIMENIHNKRVKDSLQAFGTRFGLGSVIPINILTLNIET